MLLEVYGIVYGCYWKFMDLFMDATGNLWIVSCMLLEIYGFLFN
jgi:hypothetical protein